MPPRSAPLRGIQCRWRCLRAFSLQVCLGLIVGFASLRLRHDFLAVTTIGVSFLFVGFVRKQAWLGAEMGISRIPASGLGSEGDALLILACALATVALSLYVHRSWMGFAFQAVGDDEATARSIGISVTAYNSLPSRWERRSRVLPAAFTPISPSSSSRTSFGFIVSVMLMAMVVIGGTGSTWGVGFAQPFC